MKQQEESVIKNQLTEDHIKEIKNYPDYWQNTLMRIVRPGESVEEVYNEHKELENFL